MESIWVGGSPGAIAIVGNHPPRMCGIATFTSDLADALAVHGAKVDVVALNDRPDGYAYPDRVAFQVPQDDRYAYVRAAEFLNRRKYSVVSLQHEYGIFGGVAGDYVLDLARNLNMPLVSTLHTVLEAPLPDQRRVTEELLQLSQLVVVMSRRGQQILSKVYGIDSRKVRVVPHGAPRMPLVPRSALKAKLGLQDCELLLTFGLLGPGKGIETMVEAMPKIVAERPKAQYTVLGATHPRLRETEGEAYREKLIRRAKELGVASRVRLIDRYAKQEELLEWLRAADVYVTPYLAREQITSGTLAYAVAAGTPVVSTPYLHAEELLADGVGHLVPFQDADAFAAKVVELLSNPELMAETRRRAEIRGAEMSWPQVGYRYLRCFAQALRESRLELVRTENTVRLPGRSAFELTPPVGSPTQSVPSASSAYSQMIQLSHLETLTDDTGIVQHATWSMPNLDHGYCTDDNARALLLSLRLEKIPEHSRTAKRLGSLYLAFVGRAFNEDLAKFRNFANRSGEWLDLAGSEDSQGRALWALGATAARAEDAAWREFASRLFRSALPGVRAWTSPRAWAFALLGIVEYVGARPEDPAAAAWAWELAERLMACRTASQSPNWDWFEGILAYDNARLPMALLAAGATWSRSAWLEAGIATLTWLAGVQADAFGTFLPIGNEGFYPRGGSRAMFDQQPLEAWASFEAYETAYRVTRDTVWLDRARAAADWFLGANTLGVPLIDTSTGGCFDGLQPEGVNRNQGAESTLAMLATMVGADSVLSPGVRAVA